MNRRRCPQCYRVTRDFARPTSSQCNRCRRKYSDWATLTPAERVSRLLADRRVENGSSYRVTFAARSVNPKLGGIPASMTDRGTCPTSCSFYEAGCYAKYGKLGAHWRDVSDRGLTWAEFLARVTALPDGTLWRHATAGDLPGHGDELDVVGLLELVRASWRLRGFTFTHKALAASPERRVVKVANLAGGFVVNLSADTLEHADARADLGVGPVVVVLPVDAGDRALRTPAGRTVVVCPAQTTDAMTCARCQLCAKPDRKAIVGFRAHGQAAQLIPEIVRQRRAS